MLVKKLLPSIMSAVLVASLFPGASLAAELTTGAANARETKMSIQASTKTVYVVTGITEETTVKSTSSSGWTVSKSETAKLAYNKNGLVKKKTSKIKTATHRYSDYASNKTETTKWVYGNGGKLSKRSVSSKTSYSNSSSKNSSTYKYSTNKKGQITKEVVSTGGSKYPVVYQYKSGKLSSKKYSMYGATSSYTYSCDGKKRVKSVKGGLSEWYNRTKEAYTYNKRGDLSKYVITGPKSQGDSKFKNVKERATYKTSYGANGLITKRTVSTAMYTTYPKNKVTDRAVTTYEYSYTPVKVSAALAAKVKAQQWALVNEDLNFALGAMDSLLHTESLGVG